MKIVLCLIFLTIMTSVFSSEDFHVVVNKNFTTGNITKDQLKDIYLGDKIYWSDRTKINTTLINHDSEFTNTFIEEVVKKTPDQFNRYWRRKLFSGRGLPPIKFNSTEDLISFVESNEGSIGVVPNVMKNKKVKYIKINE